MSSVGPLGCVQCRRAVNYWRDLGGALFCSEPWTSWLQLWRRCGQHLDRGQYFNICQFQDFSRVLSNLDFSPVGEVDRSVGDVDNVGLVGCKLAFNATWLPQRIFQGPVLTWETLLHLKLKVVKNPKNLSLLKNPALFSPRLWSAWTGLQDWSFPLATKALVVTQLSPAPPVVLLQRQPPPSPVTLLQPLPAAVE